MLNRQTVGIVGADCHRGLLGGSLVPIFEGEGGDALRHDADIEAGALFVENLGLLGDLLGAGFGGNAHGGSPFCE